MITYRQPFAGSYPITQRYGEKITDPNGHTGIDYGCPLGTPVLASADGTVMRAGFAATGYGYYVTIQHPDGSATVYAHLKTPIVTVGQEVKQGDVIGYSGNTGNSTGPHLHFEARHKWADYKSHFDPMRLPLICADEAITEPAKKLKEADALSSKVYISAPSGAWAWSPDFAKRQTVFPAGTQLTFTGNTTEQNGYTYCECYPEPAKYWIAVHDNDTQILDEAE